MQCTGYVWNVAAPWVQAMDYMPDAYMWLQEAQDDAARAAGITVGHLAAVGAVVVYNRGGLYNSTAGHVAYVTGVVDDSHFTVSEANYYDDGLVTSGRISTYDGVDGFIYPPPTPTPGDDDMTPQLAATLVKNAYTTGAILRAAIEGAGIAGSEVWADETDPQGFNDNVQAMLRPGADPHAITNWIIWNVSGFGKDQTSAPIAPRAQGGTPA